MTPGRVGHPHDPFALLRGDSSTVRCLPTAVTDQAYCRAPLPAPVPTESQGVSCPARSCSLPTCRRHLRATLQAALGTEHVRGEGQPGRAGARTGGHPHGPFSASDLPSEGGEAGAESEAGPGERGWVWVAEPEAEPRTLAWRRRRPQGAGERPEQGAPRGPCSPVRPGTTEGHSERDENTD